MRASLWFFGIPAAVTALAAGGIAAGCGSSSSGAPAEPGSDASAEAAPPADAGPTSCYVDASLTMFAESDAAGAGCAACVNTMCGADIQACETSCTCVNLFECLADAGISASSLSTGSLGAVAGCVPGGLTMAGALLSDPGVMGVYTCFTATCGTQCAAALPDAGIVAEGGAEEGGAGDAGATADAADGG
jgi:hypothetical protein